MEARFRPGLLRVAPHFERQLRQTCERIIADSRAGRSSSPASEWLLENYSYLRAVIREVRESLPRGYFRRLPRESGAAAPRIFSAAGRLMADYAGALDAPAIQSFFDEWQSHSVLTLAELWAIRPALKIVLLDRLARSLGAAPLEAPQTEGDVRQVITALRTLDDVIWPALVESLCIPDQILRDDPAQAYAGMDFETRDRYRREVEQIARGTKATEADVARQALDLARRSQQHVGVYLAGGGVRELRRAVKSRRSLGIFVRDLVTNFPTPVFLGSVAAITAALLFGIHRLVPVLPLWFLALLLVPASHSAIAIANLLVSYFLPPRSRVRMDFRNGIPDDCRTIAVVPTLLLSEAGIQQLVGNLEIAYLANRDRNLCFALLTDFPDAEAQHTEADELVEKCAEAVSELNARYGENNTPFFLLHRDREWNAEEAKWMGRERKRGKLDDLNQFLVGAPHKFSRTVGDLAQLTGMRYVITLDSDTQLPRDTAWKLVGSMAHPLNRPVFDERTGTVVSGHALLQPRIGISMESTSKSRFAALYSGQTGFDPYTTAVSDVYQDLFGRATFTGKGIYDVAAFERATRNRFPANALLSHDLIEGEHVRAGLVTDLEMIDDYPSRYQAHSKRKHRWVRGDWQIAMWLLPRVPNAHWQWIRNPLPLISRWKIFDNLRRSLVEVFYFAALVCAWLFLTDSAAATFVVITLLLAPIYAGVVISIFRLPQPRLVRPWAWTRLTDVLHAHAEALLTLLFLPGQAFLMADAIVRTLYRRIHSKKQLLEWESMAQVEMEKNARSQQASLLDARSWMIIVRAWNLPERYLAVSVICAMGLWLALVSLSGGRNPLGFAIVLCWIASPAMVAWLNAGAKTRTDLDKEATFLRAAALSTWRYFLDHEVEEDNWLAPDNVQEDPFAVAHRTSPTNLGLQLNVAIAAHEFGYLTNEELAARISRVQATLGRMERQRGHFYNWYDTRTLEPLRPRFLSTVDSGNLAASLIVTRQGCLAVLDQPLIRRNVLDSLRDHLLQVHDSIPSSARTSSIVRITDSLKRQFSSEPDDLFFWEGVLTEIGGLTQELKKDVEWAAGRFEPSAPHVAREVRRNMEALIHRVESALGELCSLAPWLCGPFETELRMTLRNPRLGGLMKLLRAVPALSGLERHYQKIEAGIADIARSSEGIHRSTLHTLRELLPMIAASREYLRELTESLTAEAAAAGRFFEEMEFRFLLDDRRKLLRIGWDVESGQLSESSYDLLASEARTAVFLAIARGDAPLESWFQLGRKLTYYRGHRTLLSWSGTMFEYLMPALFMESWPGTLLGESLRSVVRIQRLYARERRVPWGISESAHSARDGALNYQYRAFGVPCCGVDRIHPDDLVVAPYASVLSLMIDPAAATENLRNMASRGWLGRFGFYEAIDFRRRSRGHRRPEVIRAFMAHHQGMSFLALANTLLDNPIRKFFHSHPAVSSTELLLQERMPAMAVAEPPERPLAGLANAPQEAALSPLETEASVP